jgi:hypothetical protein
MGHGPGTRDDDEWCRRAGRDGSFIAFLPEVGPAGLGGGYLAEPEVVELVSMFVRRCRFTVTPERQSLPSNPALGEVGMQRPV